MYEDTRYKILLYMVDERKIPNIEPVGNHVTMSRSNFRAMWALLQVRTLCVEYRLLYPFHCIHPHHMLLSIFPVWRRIYSAYIHALYTLRKRLLSFLVLLPAQPDLFEHYSEYIIWLKLDEIDFINLSSLHIFSHSVKRE